MKRDIINKTASTQCTSLKQAKIWWSLDA